MRLHERLRRAIDGLPKEGLITLPVSAVDEWLGDGGIDVEPDLTVEDVAAIFGRSPTTVRTWIREGRLDAYRFGGREYRVTRRALEEFQRRERSRSNERSHNGRESARAVTSVVTSKSATTLPSERPGTSS